MKKIILISILILMFMAPSRCFAASGSILSPWKKSGVNVSLARSTDNVGIGTAAPGGLLHLATPTIYLGQAIFEQASGDVDSFDLTFRKARGTIASPTVITVGDELGFINFAGYSGAGGYVIGAAIRSYSSGTVATTRVPANLRFYTGTDAAPTVLTERMRLDNLGNIGIGTISFGTSAAKNIVIGEGSAPTTSPVDVSHVWSQNYNGAASNRLYERTEGGNSAPIALLSETGPSYGVAWNETTDSYTRLGRTAGHKIASTLPDEMLPIQANMKRCLLKDNGTVNYFLYPSNSAFKVDGSTASVLTGADGQVMVRIPKFWYRYRYIAPVHYWEVSPVKLSDFDVHPAFIKDGVEVDYRYIGAYEGVLYDTSITAYVDGLAQTAWSCTFANADSSITANSRTAPFKNLTVGQKLVVTGTVNNNGTVTVASLVSNTKITVAEALTDETAAATVIGTQKDYTATTGDKLSSVSGFAPTVNGTRANCRVMASNRGTGWRQLDYSLVSAIQLLWLTEWASFYTQSLLGAGITNVSDWLAYNDSNPIARSGNSNVIGNITGNTAGSTSAATETTKYLSYRGIENWFGHVWKFVDGFNINNNIPYITNNSTYWADNTATNYVRPNNVLGDAVTLIGTNGYPATLLQISEGFLPKTVGASSSTQITDYYYQNSGWRVALLGPGSYGEAAAGGFCWGLYNSSADLYQDTGGRLSF